VGGSYIPANQSLRGLILRLNPSLGNGRLLAIALIVVAVGVALAVLASRRGDEAMGFSLCAITGLLVSPVSWTHHWTLAVPALLLLGMRAFRARSRLWMTAAGAILLVGYSYLPKLMSKPGFAPRRDPSVAWTFAAAPYVLLGCAALLVACVQTTRTLAAERPRTRRIHHGLTGPRVVDRFPSDRAVDVFVPALRPADRTRVAARSPALSTTSPAPPHSFASSEPKGTR
jgi:hypothetical protein